MSLNNYINAACEIYKCSPADILGTSKLPNHVDSRHCVFHQLRTTDKLKYKDISKLVSRHYSTVIFGVNRVNDLVRIDKNFKAKFQMFLDLLSIGLNSRTQSSGSEIRLKYCSACDKNLPHDNFYPTTSQCRTCRSLKSKIWRDNFRAAQFRVSV